MRTTRSEQWPLYQRSLYHKSVKTKKKREIVSWIFSQAGAKAKCSAAKKNRESPREAALEDYITAQVCLRHPKAVDRHLSVPCPSRLSSNFKFLSKTSVHIPVFVYLNIKEVEAGGLTGSGDPYVTAQVDGLHNWECEECSNIKLDLCLPVERSKEQWSSYLNHPLLTCFCFVSLVTWLKTSAWFSFSLVFWCQYTVKTKYLCYI